MKSLHAKRINAMLVAVCLGSTRLVMAQPAAGPLTFQGLDQYVIAGARARAMGGTTIANVNDASALFGNPAGLSQVTAFEIRAGGQFGTTTREQSQHWVPMRPLPGISVLFASQTGTVKPPDSLGIPGLPVSAWSDLQVQYDNIVPDWSRSTSAAQPLTLAAAMPLSIMGIDLTAGLGFAQIIDLDHYYQNNNSMTPYLGQERPEQLFFTNRTDTVHVKWYQYTRTREGSVYGISPGIAVALLPGLTIGGTAAFLSGSSDDREDRVERGHLNIAVSNAVPANFMLDTVYYYQTKIGTSTYSGTMLNFGVHFTQERYSVGLTLKPPMTITRSWERNVTSVDTTTKGFPVRVDSMTTRNYHESGTDFLKFPLSFALGIVLKPTEKWTLAFDYVMRNLANAEYTSESGGPTTLPWVSNRGAMRIGVEYLTGDILALRAGYRQDLQAFSPDGSAIIGEPASGEIYCLGAGVMLGNIVLDLAYEYSHLEYEDIYQSNVNYNTREQSRVFMEIAYRF